MVNEAEKRLKPPPKQIYSYKQLISELLTDIFSRHMDFFAFFKNTVLFF